MGRAGERDRVGNGYNCVGAVSHAASHRRAGHPLRAALVVTLHGARRLSRRYCPLCQSKTFIPKRGDGRSGLASGRAIELPSELLLATFNIAQRTQVTSSDLLLEDLRGADHRVPRRAGSDAEAERWWGRGKYLGVFRLDFLLSVSLQDGQATLKSLAGIGLEF